MTDEMERAQFFDYVRQYIEKDPDAAAHVAGYAQAGLRAKLQQTMERAADMEVALSVLATKRYKGADALVKQKLEKWEGKTALRWDWLTHNVKWMAFSPCILETCHPSLAALQAKMAGQSGFLDWRPSAFRGWMAVKYGAVPGYAALAPCIPDSRRLCW